VVIAGCRRVVWYLVLEYVSNLWMVSLKYGTLGIMTSGTMTPGTDLR
jgi:hypothetical protein